MSLVNVDPEDAAILTCTYRLRERLGRTRVARTPLSLPTKFEKTDPLVASDHFPRGRPRSRCHSLPWYVCDMGSQGYLFQSISRPSEDTADQHSTLRWGPAATTTSL